MKPANNTRTSATSIVSLLFTHGIAQAMQSMASCQDSSARAEAAEKLSMVLRSGRFINDDPDKPVVLAAPDWQVPLEQLYYLWIDVIDAKVIEPRLVFPAAILSVRSGFAAVFIHAFASGHGSTTPSSVENIYEIYTASANDAQGNDTKVKPFSNIGAPVRRAWLAVATAIARLNGQIDPSPGGLPIPDVVAALGLVTERFGPPKRAAA
jgi:hypothetical protein